MQTTLKHLNELILQVPARIKSLPIQLLEAKPPSGKWSKKEIFGHLIDSALHNLQRFTYVQFQSIKVESYPQAALVKANAYQAQSIQTLLDLWVSLNRQIVFVVSQLSQEQLAQVVSTASTNTKDIETVLNLKWLIEDYVVHLEYHLKQIFEAAWPFQPLKVTPLTTNLAHAQRKLTQAIHPYVTLFRHGSMYVELYQPEKKDLQTPHDQDELYVVIKGTGTFELAGEHITFQPHDVLFAPAGVAHRFVEFSDDFKTWVIFYGPKGGEASPNMAWQHERYELSDDASRLNIPFIHTFISNSYWAKGRDLETVAQSVAHAHCFGLYDGKQQIGLARVITDYTTFAYLSDVFVTKSHQGKGLGKWMIDCIVHAPVFEKCKWLLKTYDAQALYQKFGFSAPPASPEIMVKGDQELHVEPIN
ncbi:MAG: GNAT family N-acetyltransferase [Flammeovirgaceae bacterium]